MWSFTISSLPLFSDLNKSQQQSVGLSWMKLAEDAGENSTRGFKDFGDVGKGKENENVLLAFFFAFGIFLPD